MLHHWVIIVFSWFGSVSLQYINTGGLGADVGFANMDSVQYPTRNDMETHQTDTLYDQFYQGEGILSDLQRKRRTSDDNQEQGDRERRWAPDSIKSDKPSNLQNEDMNNPYLIQITGTLDQNSTSNDILGTMMEKKYFSPWGGKRDKPNTEHWWTWKRANNIREPNMPKRVRFSPWGGKRSGQMVYKPGSKSSKIIFSTSIPELTRIVSNYPQFGKSINIGGLEFIPVFDKRHPIEILAVSTKSNGRYIREAMPFKRFFEVLPKFFKLGHPYSDVNLKKDGKRKVKFSAWGGKRSPPIIGPIWTPATQNMKESILSTILLLGNSKGQVKNEQNKMSKAL